MAAQSWSSRTANAQYLTLLRNILQPTCISSSRYSSQISIHNARTKLWDIYGIVTHITPHRCYYIKTPSGRVLMRNCCFLCRCVPASTPLNTQHQLTSQQSPTPGQPPSPCRSTRSRHPPQRLIEDPNWNWLYTKLWLNLALVSDFSKLNLSICNHLTQMLKGGRCKKSVK